MIFTKRYRYRFGDIDEAGVAYYPAILHYFHVCFEDWWHDGLGVPYPKILQDDRFGLPAVHIDVQFHAPIRYGDEPEVSLGVLRIGNSSIKFAFWMTIDGLSGPANLARVTTAAIDMDSWQKRSLPDAWIPRFRQYMVTEAELPRRGT